MKQSNGLVPINLGTYFPLTSTSISAAMLVPVILKASSLSAEGKNLCTLDTCKNIQTQSFIQHTEVHKLCCFSETGSRMLSVMMGGRTDFKKKICAIEIQKIPLSFAYLRHFG